MPRGGGTVKRLGVWVGAKMAGRWVQAPCRMMVRMQAGGCSSPVGWGTDGSMSAAWWGGATTLLVGLLAGAAAWAQPAAPALAALQQEATQAEAVLRDLQANVQRQTQRQRTAVQHMRLAVQGALTQQALPDGLRLWQQVLQPGGPLAAPPPEFLPVLTRQALASQQASGPAMTALQRNYGKINAQMAEVRVLQAAFADTRDRLNALEIAQLERMGRDLAAVVASASANPAVGLRPEELAAALEAQAQDRPALVAPAPAAPPKTSAATRSLPATGRVRAQGNGVRIMAASGSRVRAGTAGEVLYAGPFKQLGGLVIVATPEGDDVVLANLTTLQVLPGDVVTPERVLGTVGDGGVYWEIRRKGRTIKPQVWLGKGNSI
jgi:murein DD-endopeptidase MepM/ murein hydrolase activator NlpD